MSKANQPVVKVLKIFEAKGGERHKYKVGKENERYSRIPTTRDPDTGENEKDRLRREVVDQLIAEHHPEALDDTLTPEQATKAHQEAKAKVLAKFRRKIPKLMAKTYREATKVRPFAIVSYSDPTSNSTVTKGRATAWQEAGQRPDGADSMESHGPWLDIRRGTSDGRGLAQRHQAREGFTGRTGGPEDQSRVRDGRHHSGEAGDAGSGGAAGVA